MSAITLAQKTIKGSRGVNEAILHKLEEMGLLNRPVSEIIEMDEISEILKKEPTKKGGKVKVSLEDRMGKYEEHLCGARIWKEKPRSGGLGYDNLQCSSKKADGCGCLCKKHFKMKEDGKLWTGLITEPRPENPEKPDGTKMFWCTDSDGNEVVKEKKKKKSSQKKSEKPVKKKTEKVVKEDDWSEEDLLALLAKKKNEAAEKEEEKEEGKEEEKEEGSGVYPTSDEETQEMSDEEEDFEEIVVEGVEYQLNKADMSVVRVDDFSPVGKWDKEEGKIIFEDDDSE
jgi:hypothetical protein